ncbi:MAG: lanthionine synthetase LanC family protein [Pseudonocardiaceae bacterium]
MAGQALGNLVCQQMAEHSLARCLSDPAQLARITDPALCHGWAGLIATAFCAAADARSPDISAHLPRLIDTLLEHVHADDSPPERGPGLIEGSAGVALTLHSVTTPTNPRWQTCLLLN